MLIGYARVSTKDQDTALQEEALRKEGIERVFIETASGAKEDRPELARMLDLAREGDTITVWRLDRLARSIRHLIGIAADLQKRGIHLRSLSDNIDTSTASGELHFHMLAALAQFERKLIQERVTAGLASARAKGRVGGRPAIDASKLAHAETLIRGGESISKAARLAGIGLATLKRHRNGSKTSANGFDTMAGFEPSFEPGKGGVSANRPAAA
jgi:DNA invertase Pin-like site-specific DNA recombinase